MNMICIVKIITKLGRLELHIFKLFLTLTMFSLMYLYYTVTRDNVGDMPSDLY